MQQQKILICIADPNIALLLILLGTLGIYLEFSRPGLVAPGVIGAVLVLLGLSALSAFHINWLGAVLIALALAFFALEAKFALRGILTVAGAAAMLFGSLMLIKTGAPEPRIHPVTAAVLTLPFSLITSFLLSTAVRARRNKIYAGSNNASDARKSYMQGQGKAEL